MRRLILLIPIALATLWACRPPAVTRAPAAAVGQPRAAALPEPGVYVLQRVRGLALPADLKPADYDPRRGGYFERVLGGRLYLTPERDYQMIVCADVVDSAGHVANPSDGGNGAGNKYWTAGGRVYFSSPIADGGLDSIAVRVRPDTVEVVGNVFTRDRASVLPPYPLIASVICRAVRAAPARGARPAPSGAPSGVSLVAEGVASTPQHDRIIPP